MERKQSKMTETQPCMVSFHMTVNKKKGIVKRRVGAF